MSRHYYFSMIAPIMIGFGLLISGSLIAGLAKANMNQNTQKSVVFMAKKLDANNDGFISLEELTSRRNNRFQNLDLNDNVQIDTTEFNTRQVSMFNRLDRNSDGMLDDNEIPKYKKHHHGIELGITKPDGKCNKSS